MARTLALCALASFFDGYDIQSLGLTIPGMAQEFAVEPSALALAVTASLTGMAIGAMALGPLGDRHGRRCMLVLFLLLVGLASVGSVTATNSLALAVWRLFCGLGMGALVPVMISMVSDVAPLRYRTSCITLMIVCSPLGSMMAGFVGPLIEPAFGWRGIFLLGAAITLVGALLVRLLLPEFPRTGVSAGVASELTPSVRQLFAPGYRQRSLLLWLVFWLNLFVTYSLISWLPTLLVAADWSRAAAQQATGLLALGGLAGGLFFSWLADRGHAGPALATAYAATALLFLLFLQPGWPQQMWLLLITAVGVGGIGAQVALGSFSASMYPSAIRATAMGWSGGIGRLGSIVGPLVMAALLAGRVAPSLILAILMVPMLLSALCIVRLVGALGAGAAMELPALPPAARPPH